MTSVADLRTSIAALEDDVTLHTTNLRSAQRELKRLQRQLKETAAFDVLSLPPEVTAQIFLLCLPKALSPIESMLSYNPERPTAPLLFMQICTTWRNIALDTPKLWQSVAICINPEKDAKELLETWVARATPYPVNLVLWAMSHSGDPPDCDAFLESLQQHSSRIGGLTLEFGPPEVALFNATTFDWSALRTIDLAIEHHGRQDSTFVCLRDTPSLRSFMLHTSSPSLFDIGWSALTELKTDLSIENCLEALRLATTLTHAELEFTIRSDRPDIDDVDRVTHPNLQHLKLVECEIDEDEDEDEQTHALEFFIFPALRTLEIDDPSNLPQDILASFLERSSHPPLERLTMETPLSGWVNPIEPFIGLKITSLELEKPTRIFLSTFFTALATNIAFLPELTTLSVVCRELDLFQGLNEIMLAAGRGIYKRYRRNESDTSPRGRPCAINSFRLVGDGTREEIFCWTTDAARKAVADLRWLRKNTPFEVYVGTRKKQLLY
ncbi:F-box domain-containing protein [Mycena kentingensis (nom. inval.)]|nr:F-box domain-containing protein [Mycena kentingensis (nom. inval.)]